MSKDTTNKTIEKLIQIGKNIGFETQTEYSFGTITSGYNPKYDVVWFIDISQYSNQKIIAKYLGSNNPWLQYFQKLPIAVFEVEGSTTSSKNQVGNFANISIAPALYKFIVTNNNEAGNDNDTYRRGVKIVRSYSNLIGNKNVILLDDCHLSKISISSKKTSIQSPFITSQQKRLPKESEPIHKVESDFKSCKLIHRSNWEPELYDWYYSITSHFQKIESTSKNDILLSKECILDPYSNEVKKINKAGDYYYIPKLDICYGFNLPETFTEFIILLANVLNSESVFYPILEFFKTNPLESIFFPLIAFEIETSTNKHLNGGIMNLANHSFCGVLVSNTDSQKHLETYKNYLGVKNVFFKDKESL